jgi:hypothetical protein
VIPTPAPTPTPTARIALSWENTTQAHPERAPWSDGLAKDIEARLSTLDAATDMAKICPKYSSLAHRQRVQVWAELFVRMSYYESSWNPTSESVDVGTEDDHDTWSVGLLQVSVVDAPNKPLGYDYGDLLMPLPNLDLAAAIMANQINKVGTILIGPGTHMLYWAVIHPGGRYDKSATIISEVQKYAPFCK